MVIFVTVEFVDKFVSDPAPSGVKSDSQIILKIHKTVARNQCVVPDLFWTWISKLFQLQKIDGRSPDPNGGGENKQMARITEIY